MTIDTEKLRALLAAATPGPWGWNLGALETMTDAGKGFPLNFYPDSVTVAESGTCYECRARPNDINTSEANAALVAAAVNALPELLDALATAAQVSDRVQTIADESFGPFPVEPIDESLTHIERGIFGLRQALATAEAERLTLARAVERERVRYERGLQLEPQHNAYDLAARIVAEADAASKEVRRG